MRFLERVVYIVLFLVCFAAIVMVLIPEQAHYDLFGSDEYYVSVINGFTDNSSVPLVIWCSSEDMDLGGRALQEHDDFSWVMRPNFWSRSNRIMKCTMKWDNTRKSFEAFKASRDIERCGIHRMCSWKVSEYGFYFSNDEVNWKKVFSW